MLDTKWTLGPPLLWVLPCCMASRPPSPCKDPRKRGRGGGRGGGGRGEEGRKDIESMLACQFLEEEKEEDVIEIST